VLLANGVEGAIAAKRDVAFGATSCARGIELDALLIDRRGARRVAKEVAAERSAPFEDFYEKIGVSIRTRAWRAAAGHQLR
jgi:hypothetical protein